MRAEWDWLELKMANVFFGTMSWSCYAQIEIKIVIATCVVGNKYKYHLTFTNYF